MDDEVKAWFELVSRNKDQVNRNRQHNVTLIIAVIGGIFALLNIGSLSDDLFDPVSILRLISIGGLLFILYVLFGSNRDLTRADMEFQMIQIGIVSGKLENRKKIMAEYTLRTEDLGPFIGAYEEFVEKSAKK